MTRPAVLCLVLLSTTLCLDASAQPIDSDGDGIGDAGDNCVGVPNPSQADRDADGVGDLCDNCLDVPNGPWAGTGACHAQEDADGDGYGNACDSDLDQDGATGPSDLSKMVVAAGETSEDPLYDLNCDGAAGPDDLGRLAADAMVSDPVGPSGYACAGSPACPSGAIGSPLASELEGLAAGGSGSISGSVSACEMTTWSSWDLCEQTVLVYGAMANVDVDPPLQEVTVASDGSWTAGGLASGTVYAFHPKSHVPLGEPETTAIGSPRYLATLGNPVSLPGAGSGFELAGRMEVSTGVSDRGAATISIPIRIPPGTAGVQPELALDYDSLAGNGLLGVGWALRGLSAIRRCGTTVGQDAFVDPVDFDGNDRFCWDRERLVPVAGGAYWSGDGSEYRTEIDRMARIVANGAVGDGPGSFTVWTRDGRILTFAEQATTAGGVHAWALSRVEDRDGNYYTIEYHDDSAAGELWPVGIDYTGKTGASASAPYASVELVYEPRPDLVDGYVGAVRYRLDERLARVETWMDGTLVTRYWLSYDDAPGSRSRLSGVLECGYDDGGGAHCLPPTRFDWEAAEVPTVVRHDPPLDAPVSAWYPPTLGDFDGSGRVDVAIRTGGQTEFYSSPGLTISQSPHPAPSFTIPDAALFPGEPSNAVLHVGDFDGDGRDGLVAWHAAAGDLLLYDEVDGPSPVPSDSLTAIHPGHELYVEDFTGDGTDDLLFWNAHDGSLYIHPVVDGRIAATPTTGLTDFHDPLHPDDPEPDPLPVLYTGDFDGDGVQDLLIVSSWMADDQVTILNQGGAIYLVHDGVVGPLQAQIPELWTETLEAVGDFNGDGTSDVATLTSAGNGMAARIRLVANGDPGPAVESLLPLNGLMRQLIPADYDGDGTDDLLVFSPESTGSKLYPVRNGVVGASTSTLPSAFAFIDDTLVGDLTGNGLPDILVHSETDGSAVGEVQGRAGDRIVAVRDGLVSDGPGAVGSLGFDYRSITDPTTYGGEVSSWRKGNAAVYVVGETHLETPEGTRTAAYHYSDEVWDGIRREVQGFATWSASDLSTGRQLYRRFLQAFPYTGLVDVEEQRIASGQTLEARDDVWATTAVPGSASPFVHLASTTSSRWEIDPQPPFDELPYETVTTQVLGLDAFGNAEQVETTSDDGWTKSVATTFSNDPASWWIGLPTHTETTDTNTALQLSETHVVEVTLRDPVTGRKIEEVREPGEPFELLTRYVYDDWGNTESVIQDPYAAHGPPRTTSTIHDARGQTVSLTRNALGHETIHQVDPRWGVETGRVDPNGVTTEAQTDALGRVLFQATDGMAPVATAYASCDTSCPSGTVMQVTRAPAGGAPTTTYVDALGREAVVETLGFDGTVVRVARSYFVSGELASVTAPTYAGDTPPITSYDYDDAGRPWIVTAPNGETTTFDHAGHATTATRAKGSLSQSTTRTVDSRGHLVAVVDARNGTASYAYGPFDRRIEVTGPDGPTTTLAWDYQQKGHVVVFDDPNAVPVTRTLDAYGQMASTSRTVDGVLQQVSYGYDELGRRVSRSEPEGTTTWTWDTAANGIGKLHVVSGPDHTVTQAYDALSRPAMVSEDVLGDVYSHAIEYDGLGRPQGLVYPTGLRVTQVWNARGHLASVVDDQGTVLWTADAKAADGALETMTQGNGVVTSFVRDSAMRRLTDIHAGLAGGSEVLDLGIGYDDLGRVESRSDANRVLAGSGSFVESFGHDELDRITSAGVAGGPSVGFQYSPGGRIEQKSDVGSYHYGENGAGPDQLTSISGATSATFAHDDAGNVTDTLGRSLDYSSYDKPTFLANASAALTFTYGVDRRRIRQMKAVVGQATVETTYVGSLYEEDENLQTGAIQQRHYVLAEGRRIALVTTDGQGARSTRYLHADHLGSVTALTDELGVVLERWFYDAWGRPVDEEGSPLAQGARPDATTRGFTDHEHLDDLGLIHANARALDPMLGRFLSIDPMLGDRPQDLQPYSYVRNQPLTRADPSGAQDWWGLDGAAIKIAALGSMTTKSKQDKCGYHCRVSKMPLNDSSFVAARWQGGATNRGDAPKVTFNSWVGIGADAPDARPAQVPGPVRVPESKFPAEPPESGTITYLETYGATVAGVYSERGRGYSIDSAGNRKVFDIATLGADTEVLGGSVTIGRQWTNAESVDSLEGESFSWGVSGGPYLYEGSVEVNYGPHAFWGYSVTGGAGGGFIPAGTRGVQEVWTPVDFVVVEAGDL